MVQVVVFHSAYGLRRAEVSAAARLRAAGHDVIMPDLYNGQTAGTMDAALALMDAVGWPVICARARRALQTVPGAAVLAGFSMGAGVIGSVWDQRGTAAGVVLLHGIAPVPASARAGLPVQVHLAEGDPFAPRQAVAQACHCIPDRPLTTLPGYPAASGAVLVPMRLRKPYAPGAA